MRANPSRPVLVLTLALALGLAGCASSGGGGSSRVPGARPDRIVRAELAALEGSLDAYQAVSRLRPGWLRARGATAGPVLYIDGARQPGLEDLRNLRVADLEQLDYMSASDATTRFGTGHVGGAILTTSRR